MMLLERTSFVDRQKFQLHADACNCEHHWQTEHTKRSMHVLPSQDLITGFRHTHKIMSHTWYCNGQKYKNKQQIYAEDIWVKVVLQSLG